MKSVNDWTQLTDAMGLALSSERNHGHELLLQAWHTPSPPQHGQRCAFAQYRADTEAENDQGQHTRELRDGHVRDFRQTHLGGD